MKKLIAAIICVMFVFSTAYAQDKGEAKKGAPAAEKKAEQAKKEPGEKGEAKKGAPAAEKKAQQARKEPSEAQKKQQDRMKDCNAKAEGKSGDDRKKFMSSCLKGESGEHAKKEPSEAQKKQQDRMKDCNAPI